MRTLELLFERTAAKIVRVSGATSKTELVFSDPEHHLKHTFVLEVRLSYPSYISAGWNPS